MDPFERLLAHASSEVAGLDANRALWDARAELERSHTNVVCYEMVLKEDASWSNFLAGDIPKVTEHLNAKGLPMLGGASALISIWRGSQMFMFDSREFFAAIREIEALDERALWARIGVWRKAAGLSVPREAIAAASAPAPEGTLALPAPVSRAELGSADVRISDASEIRTDE